MKDLVTIFLDAMENGVSQDDAMDSVREVLLEQIRNLNDATKEFNHCMMVKKFTDIEAVLRSTYS